MAYRRRTVYVDPSGNKIAVTNSGGTRGINIYDLRGHLFERYNFNYSRTYFSSSGTIYTVPAGKKAYIKFLSVYLTSGTFAKIQISSTTDKEILNNTTADTAKNLGGELLLDEGDYVRVNSNGTGEVVISYIEITK